MSLYDLSINREGKKNHPISKPSDVLYDITESENEFYQTSYIILKINEISKPYYYKKKIIQKDSDNKSHEVIIELIHDPLPCMYPHSIFRFFHDNQIVTKENFKNTLGKKSQKRLRQKCRDSLTRMIVEKKVVF